MATGTITSPSSTVTLTATGSDRTLIIVTPSPSYSGIAVAFFASVDGTTWFPIRVCTLDGSFFGYTATLAANGTYVWEASGLPPNIQIQVAATNWASGTAAVTIVSSSSGGGGGSGTSQPIAGTSGGATPYSLISAASTNLTSVKASAGQIYTIQLTNFNPSLARYFKLYNKASAPVLASDTPVIYESLAAAVSSTQPTVLTLSGPAVGIAFGTGIAFAITGALAANDTTAIGAGDVLVTLLYA